MAKAGPSIQDPIYSNPSDSLARSMSAYGFLYPDQSAGVGMSTQQAAAGLAAAGQAALAQIPQFQMQQVQTEPAIAYSPSQKKLFVQGVTFDEDDADMTLRAEQLLGQPPVGLPQGGDWITLTPDTYSQLANQIRNPGLGRLMSKNFGIGVDQMQQLAGRGLQLFGAEEVGQNIVDRQYEDLRKNLPYRREFQEIDSAGGAIDWLAATVAQQGPNILGSVAAAAGGYFLGGTGLLAGAAGGALPKVGQFLASTAGKKEFADRVQTELAKRAAGQAFDEKFLRQAAGITGAFAASTAQNYGMGISDIYGEFREQGAGPEDANARLAAFAGGVPYALLETLPEFLLASRLFGVGGISPRSGATAFKDIQGTNLLTTGVKRGGELLKRGFKGAAVGGPAEGLTELGQESMLLGLTGQDFSDPENVSRLIESFAAGFGVGGTIGAGANLRRGPLGKEPADLLSGGGNPDAPMISSTPEVPTLPEGPPGTQGELFGAPPPAPMGPPTPGSVPDQTAAQMGQRQSLMDQRVQLERFIADAQQELSDMAGGRAVLQQGRMNMLRTNMENARTAIQQIDQQLTQFAGLPAAGAQAAQAQQGQMSLFQNQQPPLAPPSPQMSLFPGALPLARQPEMTPQTAPTLPTVPVSVRTPQQMSLFNRRGQPTPQALQTTPAQQGGQLPLFTQQQAPLPARTAPRPTVAPTPAPAPAPVARPTPQEFQRAGQMSLFTQQGQPTVAALRSAATPQQVVPTVQTGTTQTAPTGAVVTPTTIAKARGTALKRKRTGVITYEDGAIYEGELRDEVPNGQGTLTYVDGSVYTGGMKDGVPHGQGRFLDANGTIMDGEFQNGEFQGEVQQPPKPKRTRKEKKDAIQEPSTTQVSARKGTPTGEGVGKEVSSKGETAGKGEALKKGKAKEQVTAQEIAADRLNKFVSGFKLSSQKNFPMIPEAIWAAIRKNPAFSYLQNRFDGEVLAKYTRKEPEYGKPTNNLDLLIKGKNNEYYLLEFRLADGEINRSRSVRLARDLDGKDTPENAILVHYANSNNFFDSQGNIVWDSIYSKNAIEARKAAQGEPEPPPAPKGKGRLKKSEKKTEAKGTPAASTTPARQGPSGIASMVGQILGTTSQPAIAGSETKRGPREASEATTMANEALDTAIETAETTKNAAAYAEALYDIVETMVFSEPRTYLRKTSENFLSDPEQPISKLDFHQALREVALDQEVIRPNSRLYGILAENGMLNDANIQKKVREPGAKTTQEAVGGEAITTPPANEDITPEERLANFLNSTPQWPKKDQLIAKLKKMYAGVIDPSYVVGPRGTIQDYFDANGNPRVTQPPGKDYFIPNTKADEKLSREDFTKKHNEARKELRDLEDVEDQTTLADVQYDPLMDNKISTDRGGLNFYRVDGKPADPMKAGPLRLFVIRVISKYARKPNVAVFSNLAEMKRQNPALFEAAAKARREGDIEVVNAAGMAWGNNIVLFSDFIYSEDHARFIIAHETLGHVGFRGLFSNAALDKILQLVADSDPTLKHEAEVYAQGKGIPFLEAVEEVLADRAAALDTNTILRFWNWVKDQLNKMGFRFQDDSARYLIGLSRKYIRQGVGRSEVNVSSIFKEVNESLLNEQSDMEVLRFAQAMPIGSATFAMNNVTINRAMYGGLQRSVKDLIEAKMTAEKMRKEGKGVLRNVQNVVQKVLDGIQTQDNMGRKSKGYFKTFSLTQSRAARQTEYKTRYAEGTKTAHEAKFLGVGKGMTPEENLRAGQLMAYATLLRMNQYSDSQLSNMDNPVYYDLEEGDLNISIPAIQKLKEMGLVTPAEFRKGFQVQQGFKEVPMTDEHRAEISAKRDTDLANLEAAKAKTLKRHNDKMATIEDEEAKLALQLKIKQDERKFDRKIESTKRRYTKQLNETTYAVPNMVDAPAWFKDVDGDIETRNIDGADQVVYTGTSIEYKVYLEFSDTIANSSIDILRAKYLGAIHEQTRTITSGIGEAFKESVTARERKFIEDIVTMYDDMRMEDANYKDNKLVLSEQAQADAKEWIEMKFARSLYTDLALNDLATMVKGYTPAEVTEIVKGLRPKLRVSTNPELDDVNGNSIWALVRRVEERIMFAASINDDQMYAKRTIAGNYVPLTREGEWQVRVQAYRMENGQEIPVKLQQSQQDSLFFTKVANEKAAREIKDEIDAILEGEHEMRDKNGLSQTVYLRAVASVAEQTPALVDILHYDEVMYSLSRLGIRLTPGERDTLVKKVTAQNTRARANLQRSGMAGWDADVVRSASSFLEQQAYTAANKEFRHQYDEILDNPSNWEGDPARLEELRVKWESAKGPAKEIAAREYFQEKFYYDNAVAPDNKFVTKGNYYKERAKSMIDWLDSTGDIVHADDIWTNNEWSVAARTWAALAQLGGSIATGVTQIISLPTNSWAYLSAFNPKNGFGAGLGAGRAASLLLSYGMKVGNFKYSNLQYIKDQIIAVQKSGAETNKDGLNLNELSFLEQMTEEQRLDAAQFNAMTGTSRGRRITGNPTAQKFIQVWMFPFAYSEQFNRRVTLLAAYRGEYDRQIASGSTTTEADVAARAAAIRAIDITQGDYAQYNRPAFFRGGLQSFVYMYKQYPILMVQLLKNMNYEGRIIMLGTLILLSGVRGIPGSDDILDIVDGIAQRLGLKTGSIEKEFARILRSTLGEELGNEMTPILMRGVLDHFTGWSFSNRLGLGDIVPGTGLLKPSATKQEILREVVNIAGAPTSFLVGTFEYAFNTIPGVVTGRKSMTSLLGDSPVRAFANLGDAFKYHNTGAITDKKGYVVSQNATTWEIMGKALGWHPSRAQAQMDWLMADSQEQAYMTMIKTEAVRRAVSARLSGNKDTENEVKDYIREWNESTKGTRLEIQNFNNSVNRAFREAKKPLAVRALKSSARAGRAEAEELARLYGITQETTEGKSD